ncbi:DUF5119 domain-containing protein [Parabacteroides gordonii]|uniref:DUF5119 domain-containing protein n=1 Tax=Parabacteroides gordonii TaxID=574930 RepID=UPI0026F1450A|nr:DUF5119 domain-containing protein [Parabacteroides gordonii]
MNARIIMATACMACLSTFFSCTYGTPDEDWTKNGKVRLTLDWQGGTHPASMNYYFYKDGSGTPVVRRGNARGFEGTLPLGNYKVAVCNPDCRNILLEMEGGYETASGMVKHVSVLKSSPSCITAPGNLYGCGCESIGVVGEEAAAKELYPTGLVRTLELYIRITKGGKEEIALSGLTGRLTGVSSGVYIPSGAALFDTPAFMAFEPECTGEGKYRALLTLFGLSDSDAPFLYLTLKGEDGKELTTGVGVPREVGDMFRQKTSSRVILDLTAAYDEVTGLSVSLEDWKEGTGGAGLEEGEMG